MINIIAGVAVSVTALGLYARQMPHFKSAEAKIYFAALGFGVFSILFPMSHIAFVLIGLLLQGLVIACCISTAHHYRVERIMRKHHKECKFLGDELRDGYEHDRMICNRFYAEGFKAGRRKGFRG